MEEELKMLQALILDILSLLYNPKITESYTTSFDGVKRYVVLQPLSVEKDFDFIASNAFFPLHECLSLEDGEIVFSYALYGNESTIIKHPLMTFEISLHQNKKIFAYKPELIIKIATPTNNDVVKLESCILEVFDYTRKQIELDKLKFQAELDCIEQITAEETLMDVTDDEQTVIWTPYIKSNGKVFNPYVSEHIEPVGFYNSKFFTSILPFYLSTNTSVFRVTQYHPIAVAVEVDELQFSVETSINIEELVYVDNIERIISLSEVFRETGGA